MDMAVVLARGPQGWDSRFEEGRDPEPEGAACDVMGPS